MGRYTRAACGSSRAGCAGRGTCGCSCGPPPAGAAGFELAISAVISSTVAHKKEKNEVSTRLKTIETELRHEKELRIEMERARDQGVRQREKCEAEIARLEGQLESVAERDWLRDRLKYSDVIAVAVYWVDARRDRRADGSWTLGDGTTWDVAAAGASSV